MAPRAAAAASMSMSFSTAAAAITTTSTDNVGGDIVKHLTLQNPHVNVVRYEHKNLLFTLHHVQFNSEAMAIGFLEAGLIPGDVVLSWLPEHFAENMILQFACSKAGLVLYQLDPEMAVNDPESSKVALRKALALTKANVFVSQEAGSDVNYINLTHEVIPELDAQDMMEGMPFLTPRFPHLRYCLQTGFEDEDAEGWYRYAYFIVPGDNYENLLLASNVTLGPDTPLFGQLELNAHGIPEAVGKPLTNAQVIEQKAWPTYCNILEKNFHNVEGVGVIF
eukprot:CAMPEP_0198143020 /NCGR_PEP_ID=MMETSP1443-20131203/5651_1 /TAXON_ID=186043 /ORGANISM="Entomoneis sp., Strain CCMP2396" /LENGTH=278 /DNA_ID=CAMNT_0043806157 /DNA_START=185 /DNA_END=1021 /DNA_ORIENTATION=+